MYVHIPICLSRCAYCDFPSEVNDPAGCAPLVDGLLAELKHTLPTGTPLQTVYLGGGTPSCLPVDELRRLLDGIRQHTCLTEFCEITVEANPDTVTLDWALATHTNGVNRISLGVQTLDDTLLRQLSRRHTAARAYQAYTDIRQAGCTNVSVDLMFGLPAQRLSDWQHVLRTVIDWRPDHVSMYALTLEGDTPMQAAWESGKLILPDESETADMMTTGADILKQSGYEWYEVSNFALPGMRSRHNQLYWKAEPVAALGPGASGYDGRMRYCRLWPADAWLAALQTGASTIADSENLAYDAALGEYLMLAFRTADGVSKERLTARFGEHAWPETLQRCALLAQQGLITRCDNRLSPTERGFLFHSTIAEAVLRP